MHEIERSFFEHFQALFVFKAVDMEFSKIFCRGYAQIRWWLKIGGRTAHLARWSKNAMEDVNASKSPGSDWLSAAFYKENKHLLLPILADMFNINLENKTLSSSCSTAHTVVIPKTGDKEKLKRVTSYRPMSLTIVDYKMFMKLLTGRLHTLRKKLVRPYQTCGIKGPTIFFNIHKATCVAFWSAVKPLTLASQCFSSTALH